MKKSFKPIKVKLFLQGFVDAKYAKNKETDEVYDNCLPEEYIFSHPYFFEEVRLDTESTETFLLLNKLKPVWKTYGFAYNYEDHL